MNSLQKRLIIYLIDQINDVELQFQCGHIQFV